MLRGFGGKVVVVTGAASGIGAEMVRQLCRLGAIVIGADRDEPRLLELQEDLEREGCPLEIQIVDVALVAELRKVIDGAAARHGRIDYMINNAGIGGRAAEIRHLRTEDWENIVSINMMAVIFGSSFAYRHMIERGNGHIVNMASAAGLVGTAGMSAYGTVKAAVVEFSRDLRTEAHDLGVRVTVLCPGFIESRIFENSDLGGRDPEEVRRSVGVPFLSTEVAVTKMLQGVLANKAIITFPGYVKVLWFLRRAFPVFLDQTLGRKTIRGMRARVVP